MLNICPLSTVDNEGKLALYSKHRGKQKCMEEVISIMKRHAIGGTEYSGKCHICNSACPDDAKSNGRYDQSEFPEN